MAICLHFINFIIPIKNVNKVYPGGFDQLKKDYGIEDKFTPRYWYDYHLFRIGGMDPGAIKKLYLEWEERGLIGTKDINGEEHWNDFCVVEGMFGGLTLPCHWIECDLMEDFAYMKGTPKGEVMVFEG